MDRLSAADDVAGTSSELVLSIQKLDAAPTDFVAGPQQESLNAAHAAGIAIVRAELGERLGLDLAQLLGEAGERGGADPVSSLHVGFLGAVVSSAAVLDALVEAAGQAHVQASDDRRTRLAFAAGDQVRLATSQDRSTHRLLSSLSDGWMAVAADPRGLGREFDHLFADFSYAFGASVPTLFFGMHAALGPPGRLRNAPTLVIQVLGSRSVLVQSPAHPPHQHRVLPGSVMVIPADRVIEHLPLDADTAHVEIELPASDHEPAAAAMGPVVRVDDPAAARAVVKGSEDGWPMRLRAPGGAHVLSESQPGTTLAIGATAVGVTDSGVGLIELLLGGSYVSPSDAAERLGLDVDVVVAGMRRLWSEGLLDSAPVPESIRVNDRLTQVATASLGVEAVASFLAAVDPSGWRSPELGEVPGAPGDAVAVQPVDAASTSLAAVRNVVETLNERFFGLQLRPEMSEPALLVRVASGTAAAEVSTAMAEHLGSELVGAATRKLTYVLSLVDADQGWIHLPSGSDTADATPGALSAWASFRPWMLQPTSSGERIFLLGRMHGPSFA